MTKSHINFELSTTSPPIVIPAHKVSYRASVPETRMSPTTGNPVFDSKQSTINSHLSSKSGSLESNHISSSPTTLTLLENNHIEVSPLSSNSFETSRSPYGSSSRTRSLSYTKGTRGSLTVGVNHTSALARNPFGDCEIFTTDVLKPLIESNAKKSTNDSKKSPDEELGSSKPTVSQEKTEKRLRRKSSWDIVELLALDNFRNWMVCFCVVNFDLELGQAIDSMYPPLELGDEEKKSICFSAFPDSNSFDVGDTVFSFRIRCSKSGLVASGPTADAGFLYGYVFFRQKKDPKIRRGYFQKSLVLLSQYPFVGLFSRVVSILGPSYFEVGKPMLEAACHNIASWKSPSPGKLFDLPFLGYVIQVEIPQSNKPQLLETSPFDMSNYRPELQILASLPPTPMFTHFRGMIKDLWLCWELMLFAEPIVLIAPDPKVCSESVIELMDIINPIPYCGDYRPYFTIQDSDFKTFVTKNRPPSNVIIGVTNPFFTKALQHWPNIIR
ncbi:7854_t:CDS:2, partial [Acaulospora morrowiae]